jgi:hypothetical protein
MPSEGYPMMSGNIGLPLSKDILYTSSTTWAHPFSNREKIYLGLAQLDPFQRLKNQSQLSPFKGLRCAIRAHVAKTRYLWRSVATGSIDKENRDGSQECLCFEVEDLPPFEASAPTTVPINCVNKVNSSLCSVVIATSNALIVRQVKEICYNL